MTKCYRTSPSAPPCRALPMRLPCYPARPMQFRVYPDGWLVYVGDQPGVVRRHVNKNQYIVTIAGSEWTCLLVDMRSATRVEASRHGKLIEENRTC